MTEFSSEQTTLTVLSFTAGYNSSILWSTILGTLVSSFQFLVRKLTPAPPDMVAFRLDVEMTYTNPKYIALAYSYNKYNPDNMNTP